ncbi:P22 phage major capsid protein family protein, partial [Streptococcus pneumoniae]
MARQTVGFDWYMDQNISTQTFGSWAGAPKFGTGVASSALLSTGWADNGTLYCTGFTATTAVVNVGDTFTMAAVYMVNPQN